MIIKYNEIDLKQWAEFSGDHNKIHFDKNFAEQNGLNDLVVHGMLAMLDLKKNINENSNNNNSLIINLRKPIYINNEVNIAKENNTLLMYDNHSINNPNFISKIGNDLFCISETTDKKITIKNELVNKKKHEFKKNYSEINLAWVFLDALIFYLYISENSNNSLANETNSFLLSNGITDTTDLTVYQVDHKVKFLNNIEKRVDFDFGKLSYTTKGGEIVNLGRKVYGTVEYNLYENDILILQTSMGLLVKF